MIFKCIKVKFYVKGKMMEAVKGTQTCSVCGIDSLLKVDPNNRALESLGEV